MSRRTACEAPSLIARAAEAPGRAAANNRVLHSARSCGPGPLAPFDELGGGASANWGLLLRPGLIFRPDSGGGCARERRKFGRARDTLGAICRIARAGELIASFMAEVWRRALRPSDTVPGAAKY